ncbi:MAG: HNH endonuclease [Janthinobacterium lividum]
MNYPVKLIEVTTKTGDYYVHPETGLQARNPFIIEAETVYILLGSDGNFAIIDLADFPAVAKMRWSDDRYGPGYARTSHRQAGKQVHLRLHRFLYSQEATGWFVDHINCLRWDCRRANLRLCTRGQNALNRSVNVSNTIGHKGVRKNKSSGLYFVQIKTKGKQFRVGEFLTPEDAARGYDFLAAKFFGEYAHLNFPSHLGKSISIR